MTGRWRLVLVGAVAVVLAGCSATPTPPDDQSTTASGVPISRDEPIPFGSPMAPPSEPIEQPEGPVIHVLDSSTRSIYQYDLARGRMLGPAGRFIAIGDAGEETRILPGYPTIVSNTPPQDLARRGGLLAVAGGDDGTVALFPEGDDGLGPPAFVSLPPVEVEPPESAGGGSVSTGTPFVVEVAWLDDRYLLALASDVPHDVGVGYLVDAEAQSVVKHRQLPSVPTDAASIPDGGGVVAAFGGGHQLLWLDAALEVGRRVTLSQQPSALTVLDGGDLAVTTLDPALERSGLSIVDGRMGGVREIDLVDGAAGEALVQDGTIFWATAGGVIATYSLAGDPLEQLEACPGVKRLRATGGTMVATCTDDGTLGVAPLGSQDWRYVLAGDFIADIAVP